MSMLTDIATRLCMAIATKHLGPEPMLMDAAVLTAGRPHLWSKWENLPDQHRDQIVALIKHRPASLAHTGRFIECASRILNGSKSPLITSEDVLPALRYKETDRFRLVPGLNVDYLIDELLVAIQKPASPQARLRLPSEGPIELRESRADSYRTFLIPESYRPYLDKDEGLKVKDVPAVPTMSWSYSDLQSLAEQLDEAALTRQWPHLHYKHRVSLANIVQPDQTIVANAGTFYRVNAPTGSGKSVVMALMSILAAKGGHRVVVAVPTLTDVRNAVEVLKSAAAVAAPSLKIAPLHSQRRVSKAGLYYLGKDREDHPYDYRCILDVFSTDQTVSKRDDEPCFNLVLPSLRRGKEVSQRLDRCPFLGRCGKRGMLEHALDADIVVVNHHALISSTTRIPLDVAPGLGSRSVMELLLRTSPLFLVDEIDGLLQSAIDTSVFELSLSNHRDDSALASLSVDIFDRDTVPELDDSTLFRAQRASTACILNSTRLLGLSKKHLKWPNRETIWERADDRFISESLGVDIAVIDAVCGYGAGSIPDAFHELQALLRYFSGNDAEPRPEHVVVDIGLSLRLLSASHKLPRRLNDDKLSRLKAALVLRTSLHYIEENLRTLYVDIPLLVRAKVAHAQSVQQDLAGSAPFSPTPLGPLQRVVYGFKRKESGRGNFSLQVVALRGDPHRSLQYLPDLTSLIYAGVKRLFIGFSATAFFPGASSFDLQAKNLIDVPDAPGNIRFENVDVTVAISGSKINERLANVRRLGRELWKWIELKLAALRADSMTMDRARLLLVTGSHDEAEELASTLHEMSEKKHRVGWIRGGKKQDKQARLPVEQRLSYDDLAEFAASPYTDIEILVSSIYPMSRGYNIVNRNGLSALGGVVVCVRPMPSSDQPANNLAHVCYTVGRQIETSDTPGVKFFEERALSNFTLNEIRTSPPSFSRQPEEIRHFTIMNVLVTVTQLVGRARRGGTPVICYLADAAFFDNTKTWAQLLEATIVKLKNEGQWEAFSRHHAGLVDAMIMYIQDARRKPHEASASDKSVPF